ncbi:MAG: ParA family protein [Methylococcales bacterium]|jgi:cellulose biosynthesis protein BcsQ|nr:ParA family protein [Methylococcales bacterium]
MKIAFISQKGSVLKTTLGRGLATEAVKNDISVKVCDFDTEQGSFTHWHMRRLDTNLRQIDSVESYKDLKKAIAASKGYDLTIFDTAGRANKLNLDIAKCADYVILPTATGYDDLEPNVRFAHKLAKSIDPKKMIFVFTLVRTQASLEAAQEYVGDAGFEYLPESIRSKETYAKATIDAKSITEVSQLGLRKEADKVIQSIIDRVW